MNGITYSLELGTSWWSYSHLIIYLMGKYHLLNRNVSFPRISNRTPIHTYVQGPAVEFHGYWNLCLSRQISLHYRHSVALSRGDHPSPQASRAYASWEKSSAMFLLHLLIVRLLRHEFETLIRFGVWFALMGGVRDSLCSGGKEGISRVWFFSSSVDFWWGEYQPSNER